MNDGMLCKMNSLNIVIGRKMLVDGFGTSQMIIMNYILHHRDGVYQKDLENILNLRRATVSGVLKTMEKHNIIIRTDSKIDARSKKIELSSTSLKFYNESRKVFEKVNSILTKDIDTDDLEIFFKVAKKMKENLNEEKEWEVMLKLLKELNKKDLFFAL